MQSWQQGPLHCSRHPRHRTQQDASPSTACFTGTLLSLLQRGHQASGSSFRGTWRGCVCKEQGWRKEQAFDSSQLFLNKSTFPGGMTRWNIRTGGSGKITEFWKGEQISSLRKTQVHGQWLPGEWRREGPRGA